MARLLLTVLLLMVVARGALAGDGEVLPAANPFEGQAGAADEGRNLFNETCSHCHGPDAVTSMAERNLRKLRIHYGDQMADVFHKTVTGGRTELGMPAWSEVLDEKTIWQIYTYLQTVQAP